MRMNKLTVLVGDVHGCLEELDELMRKISFSKETMRLVFLGDLMDRGPDPIGCIRRVRELGAECILGNHEDKHLRWLKHESNRILKGKPNPMKPMAEQEAIVNSNLSIDDINWMKNLPLTLQLSDYLYAVHGGCEPRYSFAEQKPNQIIRARWIDGDGKAVPLNPDKTQPDGTKYWAELWKGPESIVYGHCIHDTKEHRLDKFGGGFCLGLDTGCCFGLKLSAGLLNDKEIMVVSVPAKDTYFKRIGDDE